ncbi:MAG: hypothetical protein Q8R31_02900 [Candidatus Omnitrophota bacterium]|nr:hypothetical protein [Candidatus Omnitrophota bacterium]
METKIHKLRVVEMEFNELRKEVKSGIFDTLRKDADSYFEAVVVRDEVGKLNEK